MLTGEEVRVNLEVRVTSLRVNSCPLGLRIHQETTTYEKNIRRSTVNSKDLLCHDQWSQLLHPFLVRERQVFMIILSESSMMFPCSSHENLLHGTVSIKGIQGSHRSRLMPHKPVKTLGMLTS